MSSLHTVRIQVRQIPQLRISGPGSGKDELGVWREPDGGEGSVITELRAEVVERLQIIVS